MDQEKLEQFHSEVVEKVDKLGWILIGICGKAPFIYTVGLERSYEHPELILAGLPIGLCSPFLNALGCFVRDGGRLKPGSLLKSELTTCSVGLKVGEVCLKSQANYLRVGNRLYGRGQFRSLQILWPDNEGRFPGDAGCGLTQPLLSQPGVAG